MDATSRLRKSTKALCLPPAALLHLCDSPTNLRCLGLIGLQHLSCFGARYYFLAYFLCRPCSLLFNYTNIVLSIQRLLRPIQFAQELLSTFSTSLGEVSLVPSTGGVFTIDIVHAGSPQAVSQEGQLTTQTSRLWDRKTEGGFPGR